jgi:gamma-glutamyltranspeptidase/glutathione hydrolase
MVVCPHSIAVQEGVKALKNGGNAVDAAITAAFVQSVVGVGMCGIAGFGSMHIYDADRSEDIILDFYGKAGSKSTPDMWEDLLIQENRSGYGYKLKGDVNDKGYKSITASGTIRAFSQALVKYGTIEWDEAIKPSIKYAESGYPVSGKQGFLWNILGPAFGLSIMDKLKTTRAGEEIFLKDGKPFNVGETLIQKDLGKTLRSLAKEGAEEFYVGEIGRNITNDLEKNDSLITTGDWEDYEVSFKAPLQADYRGYKISTNPAPGGGVTLIEILNILEGYELGGFDWVGLGEDSIEYFNIVASALKAAQSDRARYLGDPDFVDVPTDKLVSKKHAAMWRERIASGESISIPRKTFREEKSTTHISVIDKEGNAVALTHSLASVSGVVTQGLGFIYNSCMNCFDPIPGNPNSIAPGKSRITGLSPTFVMDDDGPISIIGAPGGNSIHIGVVQGIINLIDHGMTPAEAVYAPRIDCQWLDTVDVSSRFPDYLCDALSGKGHKVVKAPLDYVPFPLVQVISVNRETQRTSGASDPRGGGVALSE